MKLSFIVPPCFDHKQAPERSAGCTRVVYPAPNIYELQVAAYLEQDSRDTVAYHDFAYHGTGRRQFEAFFGGDDSDAYLIWTVNLSIDTDLEAISIIRRHRGNVPVILMGPGPTHFIDRCLPDSNVYIVRGEPEYTAKELVDALRQGNTPEGIQGVSWRRGDTGKVVSNRPRPLIADLDSLPFAARHLTAGAVYHNPKLKTGPYVTMITSRNCPYRCIYCVPSSLSFAREIEFRRDHGRKPTIAFRSPENVEREVAMLAQQGVKAIGFMDDNFIWTEERTAAICAIMRRYGMVWGCEARVDAITEPIAKMLGESGCRYVDLGVESFDDAILEYIKKGITVADIYRAIDLLHRYNVPVKLNVLIGSSPLETRRTVLHTLSEAKKLDVDQVMFNIVSPFPGTEFHQLCLDNGWLEGGKYVPTDVQRHSIVNLPHLTSRQMERLLFRNNISFFLSWRFVSKQLRRFRSLGEITAAARALKIKLFG